jgi:hypothetical protein
MAVISQLLPYNQFIQLSDETIDNLWSILEAQLLASPDIMQHLKGEFERTVVPALKR